MDRFTTGVVLSILLIVVLNGYSVLETYTLSEKAGNVVTSGDAYICINQGPTINISSCNNTAIQGVEYNCSVTATDEDNDTLTYTSNFLTNDTVFNITSWGYIEFTPNQSHVGNHTINISVNDGHGCSNSVDSKILSLEIVNVNDPPYLKTIIPSQTFSEGNSINFFLTDFFSDPDVLDVLTFTKTITSKLIVTISGSFVTITSTECDYTENILFTASDPYNETADSNIVSYTVNCLNNGATSTPSAGGGSSSGGGGGGTCIPDLVCSSWEDCTPNGTQRKKCADLKSCDDLSTKYLYRECQYIAHCYNEVQDFDEAGIDCGGLDCKSCPTCFDGVQNGDELGIDCGGSCTPCKHCTNGIQDFDETGIDCGGEECEICPTCDDGIKNGDELGIDCGGSCKACSEIQEPSLVGENRYIPALIAGMIVILLVLILTYRYYKSWLKKWIAKVFYFLERKGKRVVLLEKIDRDNLIRDFSALMENYHKNEHFAQHYVFDLATISRNYFVYAFKVKSTINSEDLFSIINKKRLPSILKTILKGFFLRIEQIERGEKKIHKEEFEELAEELKEIVFLTTTYETQKGLARRREDINGLTGKNKLYGLIHNSLFALEFGDVDEALQIYMEVIQVYEDLHLKHKAQVYSDVERLYKEILYAKRVNKK